jgi:ribulose-phosphate 3-epimerase
MIPVVVTKSIYVSILNADLGRLAEQIAEAEEGGAEGVHVDVMDGHFVPNLSLGPGIVEAIRKCTRLEIDVHLMIERPEGFLEAFTAAGADSVTIHQEATPHIRLAVDRLHDLGVHAGLALNPGTAISSAEECVLDLETLLIMTVNPGFGGQALIPRTIEKVRCAREWLTRKKSCARIQVDGGVKTHNIHQLSAAGADLFVAGTSVFQADDGPAAAVRSLRALL